MSRPFLDRRRVLALLLGGAFGAALLRPSNAWAGDHDEVEEEDDDHEDGDNSGPGGGDGGGGNSGPGGGDGGNDGGGNSGPGDGGDDGDDDSDPGGGGDDRGGGDRDDRDRGRGGSGRGNGSGGMRDITVLYPDGWVERIVAGVYELIDPDSREVIRRPATGADVARMLALR